MNATMRTATRRWAQLSILVSSCERLFEMNARLDAYDPEQDEQALRHGRPSEAVARQREAVCHRIDDLFAQVTREANRLTVEKLGIELARAKERAA